MLKAEKRRTSQEKWIGKELIQTRKQMPCKEMLHKGYGKIQLEKNPAGFGNLEFGASEFVSPRTSSCQGKFPLLFSIHDTSSIL